MIAIPYESIPPSVTSPIPTLRSNEAKLETQISEASQKFRRQAPEMVQLKQELEATRVKIKLGGKERGQRDQERLRHSAGKENSARSAVDGQKAEAQKLSEHSIQYSVFLREVEKEQNSMRTS